MMERRTAAKLRCDDHWTPLKLDGIFPQWVVCGCALYDVSDRGGPEGVGEKALRLTRQHFRS